jgi:copper chaperone CopZ
MTKAKFRVPDMHCSSCAMTLEGMEDDIEGVKRVDASYHKQQVEIEFDEKVISSVQITAAASDLGYTLIPA